MLFVQTASTDVRVGSVLRVVDSGSCEIPVRWDWPRTCSSQGIGCDAQIIPAGSDVRKKYDGRTRSLRKRKIAKESDDRL